MCGIAGIAAHSAGTSLGAAALQRMCRALLSRGPDAGGEWVGSQSRVRLGHRRLAIIDPASRSDQPMISPSGRFVIVFNGEIYNFRELKQELEHKGRSFQTSGDTEVILHLLEETGINAIKQLRGMFAIAVWDTEAETCYLARDPYGIKPLYMAISEEGIVFASQVKAIIASGSVSREVDSAGLCGFFLWGSIPEPWTLYKSVQAVPAGTWVEIKKGRVDRLVPFEPISTLWTALQPALEPAELASLVQEAVLDSVRSHLIADVPIAVFLSGGVDSGVIAAATAELGIGVEGITVAFDEFRGGPANEVPRARLIAQRYGIPHRVRIVRRNEFEEDLPKILAAMDQPTIDGVNTWFAAKAVAEAGCKVVLSGVGGDELFCGYDTFHRVPRLARLGSALKGSIVNRHASLAFGGVARVVGKPKIAAIPHLAQTMAGAYFLQRSLFLPKELPDLIGKDCAEEGLARLGSHLGITGNAGGATGIKQVAVLESTGYLRNQLLRDSDWASMAHSLELRTPLVDRVLARKLAPHGHRFAAGMGKRLLAAVPREPLPDQIVSGSKTGFGLPMASWLQQAPVGRRQEYAWLQQRQSTHWARSWAQVVADDFLNGSANGKSD